MTGAPIDAMNIEVSTVDVEENYGEDIIAGDNVGKIKKSINEMKLILKKNKRQKHIKRH